MPKQYFLGANSRYGFYSLYGGFPPEGAKLHIIKAGPGTGKSTLMKRMAQAAEEAGLETERILCSGDPDSLDGLYIPELKKAWVDGTAPHVREPGLFGVDSDYVNLGEFFKGGLSAVETDYVNRLNKDYKALYAKAYPLLEASARVWDSAVESLYTEKEMEIVRRRVDGILNRILPKNAKTPGRERRVFLSAVSCLGEVRLTEDINKLCKLTYRFDNGLGQAHRALEYARREALKRGAELTVCLSPLDPEKIEGLIIGEAALLSGEFEADKARWVHIDALSPLSPRSPEIKRYRRLSAELKAMAVEKLAEAKKLHDELEQVYKGHMNFSRLTAFTDREIKKLLKSGPSV